MRLKVSDSDSEVGIEVTKLMWSNFTRAVTLERSRKLEDQSLLETANVTNERDARPGLLWVFNIQSKMNSRTPTRPQYVEVMGESDNVSALWSVITMVPGKGRRYQNTSRLRE